MKSYEVSEPSAFAHFLASNYSAAPDWIVQDKAGEVVAAKWHRPASHSASDMVLAQHTLMYHVGGSTSVAKLVGGRCVGTSAQHGSVTFSPRDERNEWIRGGICEVMHVYLVPAVIERFVEENVGAATSLEIEPFFAVHDPWLGSYFMLLQSEFETFGGPGEHRDALLLTQSMELLIRHLVQWHSNLSQKNRRRAVPLVGPHPLAPRHLARILDYIDANLSRDIGLEDLAELVGMSKYHFIRSFRAATRRTPYRYLVERRLSRAVGAMRHSTLPLERIARDAGFKSTPGFSNVFKKHYGLSPGKFRARLH